MRQEVQQLIGVATRLKGFGNNDDANIVIASAARIEYLEALLQAAKAKFDEIAGGKNEIQTDN